MLIDTLLDADMWIALCSLTALEVVLGIDNIIFISILVNRLPVAQRALARLIGLSLAMLGRIILLFSLSWLLKLSIPLFTVWDYEISGRDLILLGGGLFLIAKSTLEIHAKLEGPEESNRTVRASSYAWIMFQIILLDIIFSIDSVITAIGMVNRLGVMVTAVVLAVLFMMLASGQIARFVEQHPTVKILALSFLILVGIALVGDGLSFHIPRGYIYFSMCFAVVVEVLNIRLRQKAKPVHLHSKYLS